MEQVVTESKAPGRALARLKQALVRAPTPAAVATLPSFEVIVQQHQGMVRAFLRRLCHADAIAEDIAQETFIKVRKHLGSWRGEGSLSSWVMRIAYREFLGQKRKRGWLKA